jgi:zinc transport system substrate-binding protein
MKFKSALLGLSMVCGLTFAADKHAHGDEIVTSIAPIHSLVSSVVKGSGHKVHLLIDPAGSPHTYRLKPSDVKALNQAKAVFWIGEELETFLNGVLKTLPTSIHQVAFMQAEHEEHDEHGHKDHDHEKEHHDDHDHDAHHKEHKEEGHDDHAHDDHHDHEHSEDAHLWLDPVRAIEVVEGIEHEMVEIDPANKALYEANAEKLVQNLKDLTDRSAHALEDMASVPTIVFHDAYSLFSKRFNLNVLGSITVSSDHGVGAGRLKEIQKMLVDKKVACVFIEPQFSRKMADTVVEGTNVKIATLDPLGSQLDVGEELYVKLISSLVKNYKNCRG